MGVEDGCPLPAGNALGREVRATQPVRQELATICWLCGGEWTSSEHARRTPSTWQTVWERVKAPHSRPRLRLVRSSQQSRPRLGALEPVHLSSGLRSDHSRSTSVVVSTRALQVGAGPWRTGSPWRRTMCLLQLQPKTRRLAQQRQPRRRARSPSQFRTRSEPSCT